MTTIVLFGGTSDERHVSVASAQNIVRAIPGVLAWFWTPDGKVHDVAPADLLAHQRPFEVDFLPARPAIFPTLEQALDTLPVEDPFFLLGLHGGEGEDGTVQRMLEARDIPYSGSDSEVSAATFDKERAKELVGARVGKRLRVPESRVVRSAPELHAAIADLLSRHERIVLKPVAGGSSRGLYFLGHGDEAPSDLRFPYLLEPFLEGRELTVGVIDQGDGPFALPVIEIEVDPNRTFDYEGKYLGAGTREICPANIPEDLACEAQAAALAAHVALGCEGYSRSDFIAAADGMYFLELNTLPGLTITSLVPQELRAVGIEFADFLRKQVELGSRRAVKS
ncbi:MAG TPA: ATP-grasp domain-containing protein [Thermoanaerobaculia bacterium]|jgi:D-alanine-D-alanine ligase|nr:ATP-grasp domain-containing protein [Thermoanaerobaculia bacterium]